MKKSISNSIDVRAAGIYGRIRSKKKKVVLATRDYRSVAIAASREGVGGVI